MEFSVLLPAACVTSEAMLQSQVHVEKTSLTSASANGVFTGWAVL